MSVRQGPIDSWLHRRRAGDKLLFLLVVSSLLLGVQTRLLQSFAFVFALLVLATSKLLTPRLWQSVKPFFWFMVVIAAYSTWLQGWVQALVTSLRMSTLLLLALALSMTTPVSALMDVVQAFLTPIARLGWVDSEKVALTFGLTLRLIPELSLQWREIREAQISRGLDRHLLICIVPMMVRTLKRAQDIADAIDARQLNR